MREKIYIGGDTENAGDNHHVFKYDPSRDEWSHLPPHQVSLFCIAQFMGHIITVGGWKPHGGITGKLYQFIEQSQKWEEFLKPMPTARAHLTIATTQSAIVASGGAASIRDGKLVYCTTVEVYSSETSQWHTADPLPVLCTAMTSVNIADTWYQLGGSGKNLTTVLYTPLAALIQKAISSTHQSASDMSVWKTLPDTPLKSSAAATLSGSLLTVGGYVDNTPAQHSTSSSLSPTLGSGSPLGSYQSHAMAALQYSYHPTNC